MKAHELKVKLLTAKGQNPLFPHARLKKILRSFLACRIGTIVCNFGWRSKAVVPCQNKIILNILVFYFNTEPRLKWNKIILAAKIILFHFRRGFMLK